MARSSSVLTRLIGTLVGANRSSHSCVVRVSMICAVMSYVSSMLRVRSPMVRNRGSSLSSGCPVTSQNVSQWAFMYGRIATWPSFVLYGRRWMLIRRT